MNRKITQWFLWTKQPYKNWAVLAVALQDIFWN